MIQKHIYFNEYKKGDPMTNETLKTIHRRRSIRKYKPDQINDAELQQILDAALYAPSARNQQAWHFSVIQNEALLSKMRATMKENMLNSGNEFFVGRASAPGFVALYNAPTVIIISADEKAGQTQIDCGIVVENIALAAESLNIGSCILTSSELLFSTDQDGELKRELGIPEGYRHVCGITLGYKDCEQPAAAPRKENLVTLIK